MAYRSTKEKAEAQKVARKLYVEDGLSLKEIHQQTGETMRTLRSWCNLGDWENLREANKDRTRPVREELRDSLLDKAEAQMEAGKLPHTEIGLMYRLERMIDRSRAKERVALQVRQFGPQLARWETFYLQSILTEFGSRSAFEHNPLRSKLSAWLSAPSSASKPP